MKSFLFSLYFLIISCAGIHAIDKKEFYRVFASGNLTEINSYIEYLNSERQTSQIKAYTGALLMKKANFEKIPRTKLEIFKSGHKLLEAEISKNPESTEFRFLRIAIQERAPSFLNYNKNLQEDKKNIISGFKKLDAFLQDYILQYCNQSTILTVTDLQ
jgi:hypothetical protein